MRTLVLTSLILAATAFVAFTPALAQEVTFKAMLDGKSETPPTTSAGTGAVTAEFDTATKMLSWTVEYSGLTGPATMAHFHGPAPVGKPAPIMVPLQGSLDSPISGSATLTDDQAKALMDGMMYFNIHTAANKPGEIRGQLEKAE
ncbi:MAG: CHRD domain-containing protein [Roseiarcus sp.]